MNQSTGVLPHVRAQSIEQGIIRVWAGAVVFPLLAGGMGFLAFHNAILFGFCLAISAIYALLGWATLTNFSRYRGWANATILALRNEPKPEKVTAFPGMTGFDQSGFTGN